MQEFFEAFFNIRDRAFFHNFAYISGKVIVSFSSSVSYRYDEIKMNV